MDDSLDEVRRAARHQQPDRGPEHQLADPPKGGASSCEGEPVRKMTTTGSRSLRRPNAIASFADGLMRSISPATAVDG